MIDADTVLSNCLSQHMMENRTISVRLQPSLQTRPILSSVQLEAAMSTTALPNFIIIIIIIIRRRRRLSINCQLQSAISQQLLVGSSPNFKLRLIWPKRTLQMFQMKTTSNGRWPQMEDYLVADGGLVVWSDLWLSLLCLKMNSSCFIVMLSSIILFKAVDTSFLNSSKLSPTNAWFLARPFKIISMPWTFSIWSFRLLFSIASKSQKLHL